mmetsp:Transcript_2835/g.8707  ORF Transcript_2835/g.8707 Transcript_2835/m.8707 type:complete len:247 (-) Transcript_2835:867-1607(-)
MKCCGIADEYLLLLSSAKVVVVVVVVNDGGGFFFSFRVRAYEATPYERSTCDCEKRTNEEEYTPPIIGDFSRDDVRDDNHQYRSSRSYAEKRHLRRTVDSHRHRLASFRHERCTVSPFPKKSLGSGDGDERTEIRVCDVVGVCVDFDTSGSVHEGEIRHGAIEHRFATFFDSVGDFVDKFTDIVGVSRRFQSHRYHHRGGKRRELKIRDDTRNSRGQRTTGCGCGSHRRHYSFIHRHLDGFGRPVD